MIKIIPVSGQVSRRAMFKTVAGGDKFMIEVAGFGYAISLFCEDAAAYEAAPAVGSDVMVGGEFVPWEDGTWRWCPEFVEGGAT